MKEAEAVEILNKLEIAVQRCRSITLEEFGVKDENGDDMMARALRNLYPWLFGDGCVLIPLVKLNARIRTGESLDRFDFYNLMIVVSRSPLLEFYSLRTSGNDRFDFPEPTMALIKDWDPTPRDTETDDFPTLPRGGMKPLTPPTEEWRGIDPEVDPPEEGYWPDCGWLAPDGKYYPSGTGAFGPLQGDGHVGMAESILVHFYPDDFQQHHWSLSGNVDTDPLNTQLWLVNHGWIRTDTGEDWLTTETPTAAQIKTLFALTSKGGLRFNRQTAEALLSKYVHYL